MPNISNNSVALLTIGDEILRGEIQDTNSAWIGEFLLERGIFIKRVGTCGDVHADILTELKNSISISPIVITTGGLGPTSDDITRDAVAELAGVSLFRADASFEKLKDNAAKRGRPLHVVSERQAHFPVGSSVLTNPVGTADSFITPILRQDGTQAFIISLPGVPVEMRHLMETAVWPFLSKQLSAKPRSVRRFKCFGVSEAYIGQSIEDCKISSEISVSYRPVFPEVWVRMSADAQQISQEKLHAISEQCIQEIGSSFIFSSNALETMSQIVGGLLRQQNLRVSVAESCTGGLVSDAFVSTPGASDYFFSSFVTYSNQSKVDLLNVNPESLERHGAVSEAVAREMALGARKKSGADIAVSVTGIAGPGGGTPEKPAGTVWLGLSSSTGEFAVKHFYPLERNRFRRIVAMLAVDLVRRQLLNYDLTWEPK